MNIYKIPGATELDRTRYIVWRIKEDLVADGYTVYGSADATTNYSNADYWTTANGANLNAGAYVIFKHPSNDSQLQLGLNANDGTEISWSFAPNGGMEVYDFTGFDSSSCSPPRVPIGRHDNGENSKYREFQITQDNAIDTYLYIWIVDHNIVWIILRGNNNSISTYAGYITLVDSDPSDTYPYIGFGYGESGTYQDLFKNNMTNYSPFYIDTGTNTPHTANARMTPINQTRDESASTAVWYARRGDSSSERIWHLPNSRDPRFRDHNGNLKIPEETITIFTYDKTGTSGQEDYAHRGRIPDNLMRMIPDAMYPNLTTFNNGARIVMGGYSLPL